MTVSKLCITNCLHQLAFYGVEGYKALFQAVPYSRIVMVPYEPPHLAFNVFPFSSRNICGDWGSTTELKFICFPIS